MPSNSAESSPVDSHSAWRYGLPSWMRTNIDRLNMSTNFEEYACSPPETDSGFIPEFDARVSVAGMAEHNSISAPISTLKTSRSAPMLCDLERFSAYPQQQTQQQHHQQEGLSSNHQRELSKALKEATRQSFLANGAAIAVPHILGCQSASTSTETTPSSTPQSSPFNVRKNLRLAKEEDGSLSPTANGKKWFYPGVLTDRGAEALPMVAENSDGSGAPLAVPLRKKERPNKVVLATKNYKKYMVTNFDLNAVSPTSW